MAFLSRSQLKQTGFRKLGENVFISERASVYNASEISIGDNVRIDDFCILSAGDGGIRIGSNIHIACQSTVIGSELVRLDDYCNISSRVAIYSSSDDYSGQWMTNPMVPNKYTNVIHKPVTLEKHCIVGSGSVILPGAQLSTGVAIGALSLASGKYDAFKIYGGTPARYLKDRSNRLLDLEHEYSRSQSGSKTAILPDTPPTYFEHE